MTNDRNRGDLEYSEVKSVGHGGIHNCLEEGLFKLMGGVDCVEGVSAWNRWDWKREGN